MLHRAIGVAAFCAAATWAAAGSADTLSVTKSDGDMIVGTGIPGDNFTITTGTDGEEIALKGRLRDTGQALDVIGNRYIVPTGVSQINPANPSWMFDWQYSPGAGGSNDGVDSLQIEIDFDPTTNEDFFTISGPITGFWDQTDGYFVNNPATWDTGNETVPFVFSQSWGLHYNFYPDDFNPWIAGEYMIRFSALRGQTSVLSTEIFVESVPEPAALGLLGLGLVGLAAARRRKA